MYGCVFLVLELVSSVVNRCGSLGVLCYISYLGIWCESSDILVRKSDL